MRLVKLALGWLAICVLTAAGSYYGALELDQDLGLQAKLCPTCVPETAAQPGPGTPPPKGTPGTTGSPGATGNPGTTGAPPVVSPPPTQPITGNPGRNPYPPQQGTPANPTPPPQYQPPPPQTYQPPARQAPIQQPPIQQRPPTPGVDVSGLVAQYNALLERANSVNNEWAAIERDLRSQGQTLRGDIASARAQMIGSLNGAKAALQSKDGSMASHYMQIAEQKINFLEQSR